MPSPGTTWRRSTKNAKFLKVFENTNVLDVSSSKQEVVNQPPKKHLKDGHGCLPRRHLLDWLGPLPCHKPWKTVPTQGPSTLATQIFKPKAAKRKISRNEISPTVTQSNSATLCFPLQISSSHCGNLHRLVVPGLTNDRTVSCKWPLMSVAQAFLVSRYCTSTGTTSTSKAPRVFSFQKSTHRSNQDLSTWKTFNVHGVKFGTLKVLSDGELTTWTWNHNWPALPTNASKHKFWTVLPSTTNTNFGVAVCQHTTHVYMILPETNCFKGLLGAWTNAAASPHWVWALDAALHLPSTVDAMHRRTLSSCETNEK